MTYLEFIQDIINTRGQWAIPENKIYEKHHIVPASLGGAGDYIKGNRSGFRNNSKHFNCIYLTPKEHFIAHKLLALENLDNFKLVYAWHMMSTLYNPETDQEIVITPDEYQKLREALITTSPRGENHPFYGHHLTEEHKKAVSIAQKGKIMSPETIEKIRQNTLNQFNKSAEINKEKFKNSLKRSPMPSNGHPVVCIETGKSYNSIEEAKRETGFSSIKHVCLEYKKGNKTCVAGGYHWKYIED